MNMRLSSQCLVAGCLMMILGADTRADDLPKLTVDMPFAVRGTTVTFTIEGPASAVYLLLQSLGPTKLFLGELGTLFLDVRNLGAIGFGRLGADGTGAVSFPVPDADPPPGTVLYQQALVLAPAGNRLSNAVPIRIEATMPTGPRVSQALAVTPDGSKAYVAHQLDGSVSVIDAINDVKMAELPIGPSARAIPHRPVDVGIDPDGRSAYVVNTAADFLTVIDVATDSVTALVPVPRGCRRIAIDFSPGRHRVFVTNEVENAVLVFSEDQGVLTPLPSIPLLGQAPGPVAVLPDGKLMVGHRATLDLETIDPGAESGSTTVARTPLGTLPLDIVVSGNEVLVPTFVPFPDPAVQGFNVVQRIDSATGVPIGTLFDNLGTDYTDVALDGPFVAVVAAGTGTTVIADASDFGVLDVVNLAPSQPTATPQVAAFVGSSQAAPAKLYVVNYFRETVRPVRLDSGPPFSLGPEIALGHGGAPRVPLSGALSAEEDGDWFLRSVNLFGGSAVNPNPLTCQTCHTDNASDNLLRNRQVPPFFNSGGTGPWGWQGRSIELRTVIQNAMEFHNIIGGTPPAGADDLVLGFIESFAPPDSVYLNPDGSLSPSARLGKLIFEGRKARCSLCHAAPLFIPKPPVPLTFPLGIGTGLVPANVPSLRAVWVTAPYLHDGSRQTLADVLTGDPTDVHGALAAGLSAQQLDWLIDYLNSL